MAGTKAGGIKAAATTKQRYGEHIYEVIGAKGGRTSTHGGFAAQTIGRDGLTGPERARQAGHIGGKASRRSRT